MAMNSKHLLFRIGKSATLSLLEKFSKTFPSFIIQGSTLKALILQQKLKLLQKTQEMRSRKDIKERI